jgi:RimJ/RimL family protein N-acetyltransferase
MKHTEKRIIPNFFPLAALFLMSRWGKKIFILERSGIPAGQVRFDFNDNQYIVDYSVEEGSRGKGLGKLMLERGMDRIGRASFKAVVKSENVSSIVIFESLNFREIGNYVDNYIEYKVFQLDN